MVVVSMWALISLTGIIVVFVFVILWLTLRRQVPMDLQSIHQQINNLTQHLSEWQQGAVKQEHIQATQNQLSQQIGQTTQTLTAVQTHINTLVPTVSQNFQSSLEKLAQAQQALSNLQETVGQERSAGDQRHSSLQSSLQNIERKIAIAQNSLEGIDTNLRQGQQQLQNTLNEARTSLTTSVTTLNSIFQKVEDLPLMEQTLTRLEGMVGQLTAVLLGRAGGQAAERLVENLLHVFPEGWIQQQVRLVNGIVEFAVVLPGGYLVPLDSKLVGAEALAHEKDLEELKNKVRIQAREIAEYLVDDRTIGMGIMTVPDAVYSVCRSTISSIHDVASIHKVIIVPYSILIPYVLTLYLLAQRLKITKISEQERVLANLQQALEGADRILTGKRQMGSALKQLTNDYEEACRVINRALSTLRQATGQEVPFPLTEEGEPSEESRSEEE